MTALGTLSLDLFKLGLLLGSEQLRHLVVDLVLLGLHGLAASLHVLGLRLHLVVLVGTFLLHLCLHLLGLLGVDGCNGGLLVGCERELLIEHSHTSLDHLSGVHTTVAMSTALGLCAHTGHSQERYHDCKKCLLHCCFV